MIVYRLEHSTDGCGPYNGRHKYNTQERKMNESHHIQLATHPSPEADGIAMRDSYLCGFASLQSLRQWFKGFLKPLLAKGYQIIKIEIAPVSPNDVQIGRYQLAFNRNVETSRIPLKNGNRVSYQIR
jgi:hypothetical protein